MSDEKRYPWIKRIFMKKKKEPEPVECVYAGPEVDPATRPEHVLPEPPADKPVYAGPEYFEREPVSKVYAGPEFYKDAPDPDDGIREVYAGPEYFERPDGGAPEDEPEEDAPLPPDEQPEPPARRDPPIMMVYAGPEYFARRSGKTPEELGMHPSNERDGEKGTEGDGQK